MIILGVLLAFAYIGIGLMFARREYSRAYDLYSKVEVPVYGGKLGHTEADRRALDEALRIFVSWPFVFAYRGAVWLISSGPRKRIQITAEKIATMEREMNMDDSGE